MTSTGGCGRLAAKVVGDRELGEAAERLVALLGDDTPRVRVAAVRALGQIGEGEHGAAIKALASDPDPTVAAAARSAVTALARLDRRSEALLGKIRVRV